MAVGHVLVVMRLSDMAVRHPQQDNSHVCAKCGAGVGIYPSGMAALARYGADIRIECQRCNAPGKHDMLVPAARTLDEMQREHAESYPATPESKTR